MSTDDVKLLLLRKRMLPLFLALVMVLLMATGFVFANKKVKINVDGKELVVSTLHSKTADVLTQAGVTLASNDEYHLSTATLMNGTVITVRRAVPVTVLYQGKTETILTAKATVGELAAGMGLEPAHIKLVPEGAASIEAGDQIQIITLTEKLVERKEAEKFTIVRKPDPTMEKGQERVIEEGEDGVKVVTYNVMLADGAEISANRVSEQVVEAPKPEIIHVGTRDTVETSRGSMRFSRVQTMQATAYLPTDGSPEGLTATGISAQRGIVAVDPDIIPLGSKVYIPGYGVALAADVGGAIVGNKIDLCMEDYSEAMRFGRRYVKVYILD